MDPKIPPEVEEEFSLEDRSTDHEISASREKVLEHLLENPPIKRILDSVFDLVMILDQHRQVVFANKPLLDYVHVKEEAVVQGLRAGEIFRCVNVEKGEAGCGTSEFCKNCGALKAIITGLHGTRDMQECSISQIDGNALELAVHSVPLEVDGERLTILILLDQSDVNRQRALEQIFFHDVLNLSGTIENMADLLKQGYLDKAQEYGMKIGRASHRLVHEIRAQRDLISADRNELFVKWDEVTSLDILREVVDLFENHKVATKKSLAIDPAAEDVAFVSSKAFITRVVGNMIKNAFEAIDDGGTVTVGCKVVRDTVAFWVHNEGVIPEEIQHHIFTRYYTTKGAGRGLGTYSMKLLGERYLQGDVFFTSNEEEGTTFCARFPLKPRGDAEISQG